MLKLFGGKLGDRKSGSMKGKNGVHHGSLAESVKGFFGREGALAGAKGYESRPGQAKMAEEVAEVIGYGAPIGQPEEMEELILKMVGCLGPCVDRQLRRPKGPPHMIVN